MRATLCLARTPTLFWRMVRTVSYKSSSMQFPDAHPTLSSIGLLSQTKTAARYHVGEANSYHSRPAELRAQACNIIQSQLPLCYRHTHHSALPSCVRHPIATATSLIHSFHELTLPSCVRSQSTHSQSTLSYCCRFFVEGVDLQLIPPSCGKSNARLLPDISGSHDTFDSLCSMICCVMLGGPAYLARSWIAESSQRSEGLECGKPKEQLS